MRILIAHNRYQFSGGEDAVVQTEFSLLKKFGEDVHLYERSNDEIAQYSLLGKLKALVSMGWSKAAYRDMRKTLKEIRPDVVHFHNIFYVLTPAVYSACKDEGVAVVQSLHNFRLLCSNALFLRNNTVCEECVEKKSLWRGVYHGCYKNSRFLTACVVRMLEKHWKKKTWLKMVNLYVMATEFGRKKYINAGIPKEKIMIKPNFYPLDASQHNPGGGEYALYVGRLGAEKGVQTLLEAWESLPDLPLKIIGDGPLADGLKEYARSRNLKNVAFLGYVSGEDFDKNMKEAKFLVVPSICYENFPRIIAESYAYGLPILASALGSMPEVIKEKKTGLLFKPGDARDLAGKVQWFLDNESQMPQMRENIIREYNEKYSEQRNYESLMNIYRQAVGTGTK